MSPSQTPPEVPDRPLSMVELIVYLNELHAFVTKVHRGKPAEKLRGNQFKRPREAYQAFLFAVIHSALFGTRDTLTVEIKEVADRDAALRWMNGGKPEELRLQLKELVSPAVNPKSGGAKDELEKILAKKLPCDAPDLHVAIFLNYGERRMENVRFPPGHRLAGLWFFGFSNERASQLFLNGGSELNEHRFFCSTAGIIRPAA